MVNLLTANACLAALKKDGIIYSKSYFSQMVSDGKIPTHPKPPSPKKFFYYDEVRTAIEEHKDPTRDAQREANEKRREVPDLITSMGAYESVADMSDEEKDQQREEAIARYEASIAEAEKNGIDVDKKANIGAMTTKEINDKCLFQDLRLKTVKADEAENLVTPTAKVKTDFETASRILRDGLMGLGPRFSSRFSVENNPYVIRTVYEEEMTKQLKIFEGIFNEL